jgi:hypothetical protein
MNSINFNEIASVTNGFVILSKIGTYFQVNSFHMESFGLSRKPICEIASVFTNEIVSISKLGT